MCNEGTGNMVDKVTNRRFSERKTWTYQTDWDFTLRPKVLYNLIAERIMITEKVMCYNQSQ